MKALRVVEDRRPARKGSKRTRAVARLSFDQAPDLLTFAQAAQLLDVGKNSITVGTRSGHIRFVQLTPTLRRIPKTAIAALLGRNESTASGITTPAVEGGAPDAARINH